MNGTREEPGLEKVLTEGAQFQVSADSTSDPSDPSAYNYNFAVDAPIVDSYGNFVVVWKTSVGYRDFLVLGRKYNADGSPQGQVFEIAGPIGFDYLGGMHAVGNDQGEFLVVWGLHHDPFGTAWGRRFTSDGNLVGSEFEIDGSYPDNYGSYHPRVDMSSGGEFVVTWFERKTFFFASIYVSRFDSSGAPVGNPMEVAAVDNQQDVGPTLAVRDDLSFLVVWPRLGQDSPTTEADIYARLYTSEGQPTAEEFLVNTFTQGLQANPRVSANSDGEFLVVWDSVGSSGTDLDGKSIQAQLLDSIGSPRGAQFQVNLATDGDQFRPSLASWGDDFVVSWSSSGNIVARDVNSDGIPLSAELTINSAGPGRVPYVDASNGRGAIAWTSGSPADSPNDTTVQARRINDGRIFRSGFESGDLTDWTNFVTD